MASGVTQTQHFKEQLLSRDRHLLEGVITRTGDPARPGPDPGSTWGCRRQGRRDIRQGARVAVGQALEADQPEDLTKQGQWRTEWAQRSAGRWQSHTCCWEAEPVACTHIWEGEKAEEAQRWPSPALPCSGSTWPCKVCTPHPSFHL